jgi:hypothetical protein
MTGLQWIVLISFAVYIFLGCLALKFPRGRGDWKMERKETLYLAMSVTVFLLLFFLLWYVSAVVDWPPVMTMVMWIAFFTILALILIAIVAPHGVKLKFEKKDSKNPKEEE